MRYQAALCPDRFPESLFRPFFFVVPLEGFEPPTLALRKPCSTAELQRLPTEGVALNGFEAERQLPERPF